MAQTEAPTPLDRDMQVINPETGSLTPEAAAMFNEIWRQVVAGFVVVPCVINGSNNLVLTPKLHKEGGSAYADHMIFAAVATANSTAAVVGRVAKLSSIKVYKDGGATQAGRGDIIANRLYLFCYVAALDGGAGGFVLK